LRRYGKKYRRALTTNHGLGLSAEIVVDSWMKCVGSKV
jgi:hypothetical protein